MIYGNKVVWMKCRDLPLSMWNEEYFKNVVATIGVLVGIDKKPKSMGHGRIRKTTSKVTN